VKRPQDLTQFDRPSEPPKVFESDLTPDAIRKQLEKILASAEFAHSERLSRFLRHSVEHAPGGRKDELKEYSIGLAVFDREQSYDPRVDPIVRVEAGRLRSKLREYYESHGREDELVIEFPKGSYAPVFQRRKSTDEKGIIAPRPQTQGGRAFIAGLGLVALVGAILSTNLYIENYRLRAQLDAFSSVAPDEDTRRVWGTMLAQDADIFVVFGSPMFFSGPDGSNIFVRHSELNDASSLGKNPKFEALQKRLGPLFGPRYDYALMGDARALQSLTAFLCRKTRRFTALPAHLATWDAVRDGNIIILGTPRMLPFLNKLPVHRNFVWDPVHNIINRDPQPGEQAIYETPSHFDNMSYALIGRFPGLRPNRQILSLTAHSAPGIGTAIEFLTKPDNLHSMVERLKISAPEDSFEMLVRIYVDRGTAIKTEYVAHHLFRGDASPQP
jgi:hypothetical protein